MALSNEQLLAFVRRNPIGVGCGLLCLVLGGTIYWRYDKISAAETLLDEKTTLSNRLIENVQNNTNLKEQYDDLVAANKGIEGRLIRTTFGANYGYFYGIGTAVGIPQASIRINQLAISAAGKAVPKGGFVPVGFTLSIQGTFAQVLDYLHRLENGNAFFRVLTASCSKVTVAGGDQVNLNLNLELLGKQE